MASQADAALATGKHNDDIDIEDTKELKQIVSWSNADILALLDIWADVDIQGQLDGMRRNKKVFDRISGGGFARFGAVIREMPQQD